MTQWSVRQSYESVRRRVGDKPLVLHRHGVYWEDHPRFNVNRLPVDAYPVHTHDEPMRVCVYTGRGVTSASTTHAALADVGADFLIRISMDYAGPGQVIILDARDGHTVFACNAKDSYQRERLIENTVDLAARVMSRIADVPQAQLRFCTSTGLALSERALQRRLCIARLKLPEDVLRIILVMDSPHRARHPL